MGCMMHDACMVDDGDENEMGNVEEEEIYPSYMHLYGEAESKSRTFLCLLWLYEGIHPCRRIGPRECLLAATDAPAY